MKYIIFAMTLGISIVYAECSCECIDGKQAVICENAFDIKPICSPVVCPIAPTRVAPITAPRVPPIGMKGCYTKQVLNKQTNAYEWREVCE